ncbi:DUF6093 family protein [Dactylosporangium sp. NPDC005572]|uniref:DUF6093 family protein n=1 Tax=Dactylosporangium sp. NPDC005572 TaxID=3156889 RepID=UPI0033A091AB
MSRESVLAAGRRAAERGMVDTCRITRVTAVDTDETTGETTSVVETLYDGRCRVQRRGSEAQRENIGEASLVLLRVELQLPMSAAGLREGDDVEMTTSVNDPDLVGRTFRVRDVPDKTDATARRLTCVEVTS